MHQGCFVWTPTPPLAGRRTPRPDPVRVCVCSSVLAGLGGPASRARFGAPHLILGPFCLSALFGPLRAGVALFLVLRLSPPPHLLFLFFFSSPLPFSARPLVSCFLWFPAPDALGLGALCCLSCWPRAFRPSVRLRPFCVARLAVVCCLVVAPPPLCVSRFFLPPLRAWCFFFCLCLSAPPLSLAFSGFLPGVPWALALGFAFYFPLLLGSPCPLAFLVSPAWPLAAPSWLVPPPPVPFCDARFSSLPLVAVFFFSASSVRPRCLWLSLVSGPECPGPWRCVLFAFRASRCSALRALSPRLCVSPGRCLLPGGCCPPPPRAARCSVLFFSAPLLSLAFSGFRPRVPWASALRVVCFVGLPLFGSLCALASFVLPAWPFAAPRWLLPPPPSFVSRGFCRFRSVLCAVCCAVLCVPGCGAAPRCCALCRPVLCCCVLCCFAALVWCRRLLCRALWRCPSPWGPVLCSAVFSGVPPRCVCFVVAWWCVPLFAALLCAVCVLGCCAVRSLSSQLCAVLCFAQLVRLRCAVRVVRAVAGAWCCGVPLCVVVFPLVCCGAVLGLVARGCLLVPCCGALLSVFLCWWCWFVSFPCVCGAVLCCASCCSVPVWSALLLVPRAVACFCALWCLPGCCAVW